MGENFSERRDSRPNLDLTDPLPLFHTTNTHPSSGFHTNITQNTLTWDHCYLFVKSSCTSCFDFISFLFEFCFVYVVCYDRWMLILYIDICCILYHDVYIVLCIMIYCIIVYGVYHMMQAVYIIWGILYAQYTNCEKSLYCKGFSFMIDISASESRLVMGVSLLDSSTVLLI